MKHIHLHGARSRRDLARIVLAALMTVVMLGSVGYTVVPKAAADSAQENLDVSPIVSKSITKVSGGDGDQYELHLTASGDGESSQIAVTKAADIVIVADKSGSMRDYNRDVNSRNAVSGLAKKLLTSDNANLPEDKKVLMSVVTFSTFANLRQGYTDSADAINQAMSEKPDGGTNWEAGFKEANNLSGRTGVKKYIIFLSDGNPKRRNTQMGICKGKNDRRYPEYDSEEACKAAKKQLKLKCKWKPAKDGHVLDGKFIYGEDDDDPLGLNYAAGLKEANRRGDAALYVVKTGEEANKMADLAAESGAVTGKALDGTNAENLASAFDFIYQSITASSTVQIFSFNDELSQWVDPVDFADQPDGADITRFITVRNGTSKLTNYKAYYRVNSSGSRTVNVVLNGSSGIAAGESDVLDVSFRIKPNDAVYKDFAEKKTYPNVGDSGTGSASSGMPGYFTNGDANMSYCPKLDANGTVSCQPETVNFGRPVMQVRLGRIDIVKHWSDGADKHANDTVTVQLQRSASGGPAENVGNPIELNAANNWTAQVDGLLPGYTYTVVETSQDDRYAVTYTYGDSSSSTGAELTKQMVWGSLPDTGTLHADITNTLETASLSNAIKVQKKIDGRDWRDSDEFTFTLTPTDSSNPMPVECANQNSCTVAVNAKSPGHTGAFGDITYEAGAREYRYTVAEQAGSAPAMHYSKARYNIVVKVEKAQDGKWTARLSSITQVSDDNGGTGKETSEPTMPITFTNTYTAVAALPLTGGATARTWLLTSGSLGVLALLLLVGLAAQKRGTLLI